MTGASTEWNADLVRTWLASRLKAARLDQAAADRQGYEARDDYGKAAAEEWVCRTLSSAGLAKDQATFAGQLKELLVRDDYTTAGIYDDRRFDRHVRENLRKIARMTKANDGFANTLRYQS